LNNVRQTTIGYDAATGRIATMLANGSNVPFTWSYLPGSDLKSSLAYPNGLTASWTYDANGQLLQVRNATPMGVISQYDYTYDAAGRRTAMSRSGSAMSESRTDAYGYNARGEITSAMKQGVQTPSSTVLEHAYQYDDIGNRLTSMDLGCSRAYTSNGLNQYTDVAESPSANAPQGAVEEFEPLYDDDGNQTLVKTATGVWSVLYNGENRPVLWTRASDGATVSMAFDRMGRRVRCHETGGAAAGSVMTFAYDGYVCVARRRHGTGGAFDVDRFVWDPAEPVATRPLAFCMADSAPQYYAHDGNKNVSELVSADGAVSAHYEYAPFGAVTYSAGPSAALNPYRFSSEYADSSLALVYYNYRHYEPVTGRWGQYDFYMESGGCNLYEYVYNSPLLMFDNKGREPISLIGLLILIMSNPSVANAPGPDDAVVYSAGPMGMVIDLMGGKIITASLSCCGRFLGYIRFKVAYFRAERLLRSSVMELKGKSVAVGAFDARTGQYVVTGSGPVMTESTDAMKILAEKAGGLGVVKNGKCIGCCAEFHAADKLIRGGSIITDIRFTEAIRPRNELPIKMCENCLDMFKSNVKSGSIPVGMPTVMFLPGTSRLVDGWLNGNN
jgi:RHS repeat-associated protein